MIVSVKKLIATCKICEKRADFEIVHIDNRRSSGGRTIEGTRAEYFCTEHMPQDGKDSWNFPIPDLPSQQLK